ncbi:GAF domain-containing protein [Nocardia jejuensis]|uniref:GAF domain-containing protein n=1 Tax=Nocardia jejuensis TaxID=328049 RepID=UPI000A87387F|nr:GAF domain-containing protein [Nocardia jejuensis]
MTWYFVESLARASEPMTIINKNGAPREWISLRSLHRHEAVDLDELLEQVRNSRSGEAVQQVVRGRDGTDRLIRVVPVLGPEGDVYGMHVWIGGLEDEPTPHRPAAGMCFHLDTLQAQLTEESWAMSNLPEDAGYHATTLSPAEMFRRVVRYDALPEVIALGIGPDPAAIHDATFTVLHNDGHLMLWQAAARGRADEQHTGMRGLNLDITDFQAPPISPLEALGLNTERPGSDGPAAALLASTESIDRPVITQWIGPAPKWIDWERETGDTVMFHPQDWARIRETFTTLEGEQEHTLTCRVRGFTESGWQPVQMCSRRYPGEVGANLHVVRISKTE